MGVPLPRLQRGNTRFMTMTSTWRNVTLVVVALALPVALVACLNYRGRTVVLGEQHGAPALVSVRSVPVRSAEVMQDGRHVRVRYVGGTAGACGDFSSVRLTKHRGKVNVRVQVGAAPGRLPDSICTLGGVGRMLVVPLREYLPSTTPVRRAM